MTACASAAAVGLAARPAVASASDFPSAPIRIVVPLGPGGLFDIAARSLADELTRSLGVPMIVENKPGGRFAVGLRSVATARPDGYTVAVASQGMLSLFPSLYPDLPYQLDDFAPLAPIFRFHAVIAVRGDNPATSAAQFLAQAKQAKAPVLMGTAAIGGTPHLVAEELLGSTGLSTQPVLFRSEPLAVQALLGGHVPAVAVTVPTILEHHRSGKARILVFSGAQRQPALPDVPTMREIGVPAAEGASWTGLFAPAGTPAPVVDKLAAAITAASFQPSFRARLLPDMEPFSATPAQFAALARQDAVKWGRLIREKGIAARIAKN